MLPKSLSTVILLVIGWISFAQAEELFPEGPDCGFFTNDAYTQSKRSMEITQTSSYSSFGTRVTRDPTFSNSLGFAYGFTDRLEGDLSLGYNYSWPDQPVDNPNGPSDLTLLLRYNFLAEPKYPLTLTFGPELLLPTGNAEAGFGYGSLSVGFDLTMAKEWHPLFFQCFEFAYANTLQVPDPPPNSFKNFNLNHVFLAMSFGFRPYEKFSQKGNRHHIHVTLEALGVFDQLIGSLVLGTETDQQATFLLVPGVKYGYRRKDLSFIYLLGLGFALGLAPGEQGWGVVLQTEWGFNL